MNNLSAATDPSLWTRTAARLKRVVLATALAAFLGAGAIASFGAPTAVHADTHVIEYHNEDGSVIEFWLDDKGKLYAWGTEADGEQWSYTFDDNPNPDDTDSSGGPFTPEMVKELIKKYAGEMTKADEEFWASFFGNYISDKNDGIVPIHNPNPVGYEYEGETGGGLGFDPNGGDPVDQFGDPKGDPKDPNEGNEDRDDYGTETPKTGMFEDDMPGPPELINPNPTLRVDTTVGDPFNPGLLLPAVKTVQP